MGGGLWHPDNEQIHKVRESIDERPRRWRRILNEPGLKHQFLPSASKSSKPEAGLKAFAEKNQEGALKVRPKVRVKRLGASLHFGVANTGHCRGTTQTIAISRC